MSKFYVYTSRPSKGARALAKALGGKRIQTNFNQTVVNGLMIGAPGLVLNDDDVIINWGDSQCTHLYPLNKSAAIRLVANKALAFDAFSSANVPIPAYAKTKAAVAWQGTTVVRHKLTGHSGEGIEICDASELPDAPLYVQYIKKEDEYRVHVGRRGDEVKVIAVQRKARDRSNPNPNWQVRNHDNGFIFVRGGFTPPSSVVDAAKQALVAVGLDFGAVDVIYNRKEAKPYVLEINTAPGLEGSTITDYATFFRGDTE
jgi:glutathione synthase/RimK-type ligase-like ATP-grasp enzyme